MYVPLSNLHQRSRAEVGTKGDVVEEDVESVVSITAVVVDVRELQSAAQFAMLVVELVLQTQSINSLHVITRIPPKSVPDRLAFAAQINATNTTAIVVDLIILRSFSNNIIIDKCLRYTDILKKRQSFVVFFVFVA